MLQGALGDCWLLSAMAVVSTRPEIMDRMFPVVFNHLYLILIFHVYYGQHVPCIHCSLSTVHYSRFALQARPDIGL